MQSPGHFFLLKMPGLPTAPLPAAPPPTPTASATLAPRPGCSCPEAVPLQPLCLALYLTDSSSSSLSQLLRDERGSTGAAHLLPLHHRTLCLSPWHGLVSGFTSTCSSP